MSASWTQSELDALRRAYARGTLRVVYDGRVVEYGSASDLLSRIRVIERDMAAAGGGSAAAMPTCGFASFSRD